MNGFRNPMDEESVNERLVLSNDNPVYDIAVRAAGHQGAVVDQLSWKLKRRLPALVAELASEVCYDNGEKFEISDERPVTAKR